MMGKLIYIYNVYKTTVSCYNSTFLAYQSVYKITNLSPGTHKFKGVKKTGTYMQGDELKIYK